MKETKLSKEKKGCSETENLNDLTTGDDVYKNG